MTSADPARTPRRKNRGSALSGCCVLLGASAACRTAPEAPRPVVIEASVGDEIVVCGERFSIGAPVVLWFEPRGYSAYETRPYFTRTSFFDRPRDQASSSKLDSAEISVADAEEGPVGLRYRPGRSASAPELAELVAREGWTLRALQEQLDLFVIHYDACGTSEACFRVLHDERQLSVHFLLDVDGTLYQTLDLVDEAWHARAANPRSIGVEIAHVGAFPPGEPSPADTWYAAERGPDADAASLPNQTGSAWEPTAANPAVESTGVRLMIPERWRDRIRTPDFIGRPARPKPITGEIHGATYEQYDFTPEQYESLARLSAALAQLFPRIDLEAPRAAGGRVRTDALTDEEELSFQGILGHYHLQTDKRDPGPAFDWERLLAEARGPAPFRRPDRQGRAAQVGPE